MKFYLPNLDNYNVFFINYLNQNKEMFEDDVEIGGVYGCFKGMKWNGGRTVALEKENFDNIIATFNQYNSINIPIRFTLTNTKLTKEDILYDDYCNDILREANDRKINEVIVQCH